LEDINFAFADNQIMSRHIFTNCISSDASIIFCFCLLKQVQKNIASVISCR